MTATPFRTHSLATAALTLAAVSGSALAQTEIFMAEYQFNAARMSAVGRDGSSPRVLFDLPPADWLPLGVTFRPDTGRLIWMDSAGASELNSSELDGSARVTLATPSGFSRGASLDADGRVYFSSNANLRRVNADGSGLITIFSATSGYPLSMPRVDATNGHVYVGVDGTIWRMNLDGTELKAVVTGVSQVKAIGLDIENDHVYWADGDTITDFIGRARLDNTEFTVLIDVSPSIVQSPGLTDLLVNPDSNTLYFQDELAGTLTRANLDGTGAQVIYTSPAGKSPSGMVFDTGEPVQPMQDCDGNGIADAIDIAAGAPDCDNNGFLDSCQVNPCPERIFLIDQGSDAANTLARAVGAPSQWEVFQPFDVPSGGWNIGEIGIDGYVSNYADGLGVSVRVVPDNGTGARPDDSVELAAVQMDFRFNLNFQNWVYADLDLSLEEGRYWVWIEANNPQGYAGGINHGFSGPSSISRGVSGNFSNPASPIALRLVEGSAACPADWDNSGGVDGDDITAFFADWQAGNADIDASGGTDGDDIAFFFTRWQAGC